MVIAVGEFKWIVLMIDGVWKMSIRFELTTVRVLMTVKKIKGCMESGLVI